MAVAGGVDSRFAAGTLVAGRYRLEHPLGYGGMGVVWAAIHEVTRRRFALKVIKRKDDPVQRVRMLREARASCAVQHRHVREVYDIVEAEDGSPVMVMEYLVGESLADRLARDKQLPLPDLAALAVPVASAVGAAHALGIVHRDLKPENIFFADGPPKVVKVLDFGIAKLTAREGPTAATAQLTESGAVVGTPCYMSPEQVFGERTIDHRADIWALGVIFYQCLSGALPTAGDNIGQVFKAIVARPIRPLNEMMPELPSEVAGLVDRMLSRTRSIRPADLSEVLDVFSKYTTEHAPGFGPPVLAPPADGPVAAEGESPSVRFQDLIDPLGETLGGPEQAKEPVAASAPREKDNMSPGPAIEHEALPPSASVANAAGRETPANSATRETPANAAGRETPANSVSRVNRETPANSASRETPADSVSRETPAVRRRPGPFRRRAIGLVAAIAVAGAAVAAVALGPSRPEIDAGALASFSALPRGSVPADPLGAARFALGRALFADPRLSANGDVACATCHPLGAYAADGMRLSRGSGGVETPRNTLSTYNAGGYFALLWDGRQPTLFLQAQEVLQSPRAMATTPAKLTAMLSGVPEYRAAFGRAFPGEASPVTFENVARALAVYEGELYTRGRWDRFLEGDRAALTDEEKAGFNRFVSVGCIACHFGPNVGATMFQKLGLVKPWPVSRDLGRYQITKLEVDRMVFRVPSLRNVAETAPYFHDGSEASIEAVIRLMARHQIGKELDDGDVALIAAWLRSLTGEIPPEALGAKP